MTTRALEEGMTLGGDHRLWPPISWVHSHAAPRLPALRLTHLAHRPLPLRAQSL